MRADFDTVVATLRQNSLQAHVRNVLWKYDVFAELARLRASVDTVSTDLSFYVLLRRALTASQDMHTDIIGSPEAFRSAQGAFRLYLPVSYGAGRYYISATCIVGNDTLSVGTEITRFQGMPISEFLAADMSAEYYRYDRQRRRVYFPGFFNTLATLNADSLALTLRGSRGTTRTLRVRRDTRVRYPEGPEYQDTTRVEHWPDERALYIRITRMDRSVMPSLRAQIVANRSRLPTIDRVIVDIRDNPGGEDRVWTSVYALLIAEPMALPLRIDDVKPSLLSDRLARDGMPITYRPDSSPALRRFGFYTIVDTTDQIVPDSQSLRFNGPIALVVANVFSSAGSALHVANVRANRQLISVGRPSGYFLGVGYSPVVFTLPHSGWKFRFPPGLNVTEVQQLSDVLHDRVDVEVPFRISELVDRDRYRGNPYHRDFMVRYDPFISAALKVTTIPTRTRASARSTRRVATTGRGLCQGACDPPIY